VTAALLVVVEGPRLTGRVTRGTKGSDGRFGEAPHMPGILPVEPQITSGDRRS
jgi:hypothetical protein